MNVCRVKTEIFVYSKKMSLDDVETIKFALQERILCGVEYSEDICGIWKIDPCSYSQIDEILNIMEELIESKDK